MKEVNTTIKEELVMYGRVSIRTKNSDKGTLNVGSWRNDVAHIWGPDGQFYRITNKGTLIKFDHRR